MNRRSQPGPGKTGAGQIDATATVAGAGDPALSRRAVLKGLGALGAGAALAACSSSAAKSGLTSSTTARSGPASSTSTSTTGPARHTPARIAPEPGPARGHRHAAADRAHRRADDGEPLLRRLLRHARAEATASSSAPTASRSTPTLTSPASSSRRSTCRRRASSTATPARTGTPATSRTPTAATTASCTAAAARSRWATGTAADIPFYYGLGATFPLADRWFCSVLAQTYPEPPVPVGGNRGGHHQHQRPRR